MGGKLKRFFVQPQNIGENSAEIKGAQAHHIRTVMRLGKGDAVAIFDGKGNEYNAVIDRADSDRIKVSLGEQISFETETILDLCLAQGYLKDKKMDLLVRHLVEIGVNRWLPFWAYRCVPSPDEKRLKARVGRWEIIAQEALKQSRRNHHMIIDPPVTFDEALRSAEPYDLKLMCWEETAVVFSPCLDLAARPSRIFLMIGPEGGLEKNEATRARDNGFQIMGLGPRILRAETAALAACTLLQYLYGDMGPG